LLWKNSYSDYQSLITWAPTDWLLQIANPTPLLDTTTSGADGQADRRVDLPTLFAGMLRDGMRDPLVLGIGLNGRVRLETGNQRIRCLVEHGVLRAPVIGFINDSAVTNPANGHHQGEPMKIDFQAARKHCGTYVDAHLYVRDAPLTRLT
jgi:hypothetical protein